MKVVSKTAVRFQALIKASGEPEMLVFWSDPARDKGFQKAVRENRVVTLRQFNVGTKKDFGRIGFFAEGHSSYIRFPKRLKYAPGTRVVGIKYEAIKTPPPKDPLPPLKKQATRPQPRSQPAPSFQESEKQAPAPPDKPLRVYEGLARIVIRKEIAHEVSAASPAEARRLLESWLKEEKPDWSLEKEERKLVRVGRKSMPVPQGQTKAVRR